MKLMRLLLLTAVVVGTWTPLVLAFDPIEAHTDLLTRATGYFAHDGGTGGEGGTVVYVTNLNDGGEGSLRDAAETVGAFIILFEDGLSGTITVNSPIDIKSNKTIWGRHRDGNGANIFVHPASNIAAAFRIKGGKTNIIISNLKGDAPGPNDAAPDWALINASSLVWVDHITLIGDGTNDMDGAVDTTGAGVTGVTISWLRVEDWSSVHGIRDGTQATLHHNYWKSCRDRTPRTVDPGTNGHAYNNWVDQWDNAGMTAATTSELLAENNIFDAGADNDAITTAGGKWNGSGNVFTNGATAAPTASVFTPPYSYTLDPTGTTAEQQALRDLIKAEAGWQSSFGTTPPPPVADFTPPSAPTNLRVR